MTAFEYLRAHVVSLVALVAGVGAASLVAAVCGCPTDAVVLIAIVLTICAACALAVAYLHANRFYRGLRELSEQLEHPYQLHSLVEEPASPDHAIVYDALKAMGMASAQEVAQANAKAKEHREFVEGWVHDVKAPLASCELIAKRVAEPERTQLESELDRIGRKVQSALWYARSDCANQDYAIREVSLADVPRAACRDYARFLIEHGCTPHIDIDDVKVFTDMKQTVFVVSQLVENSAKYGAHNLWFRATESGHDAGSWDSDTSGGLGSSDGSGAMGSVSLVLQDDGRGIPAAEVSRVFERGFTGTRGREGAASTGMGLYLAARLCDQLGLGLSISSVDGKGTCATIVFPLDRRRLDAESERQM